MLSLQAKTYRITLTGHLSARFVSAFGQAIVERGEGTTTIVSEVADQAQLSSILERIASLGIELRSVEEIR